MRPFLLLSVLVAAASAGKKLGCFKKSGGDWNVYSSLQHMGGAGSPAQLSRPGLELDQLRAQVDIRAARWET